MQELTVYYTESGICGFKTEYLAQLAKGKKKLDYTNQVKNPIGKVKKEKICLKGEFLVQVSGTYNEKSITSLKFVNNKKKN